MRLFYQVSISCYQPYHSSGPSSNEAYELDQSLFTRALIISNTLCK